MMIVDESAGDCDRAHLTIDVILWFYQSSLNRGRIRDDLKCRAGLVHTLQSPVGSRLGRCGTRVVGIESWCVRQRQNLTCVRLKHDRGS